MPWATRLEALDALTTKTQSHEIQNQLKTIKCKLKSSLGLNLQFSLFTFQFATCSHHVFVSLWLITVQDEYS